MTGSLIGLHTGGCGCSHPVHEWCLVKWYTMYGKRQNECPLCKMPGVIRDIDVLIEKFRDRIPVRVFIDEEAIGNEDWEDGNARRRNIILHRQLRYRAYISILLGLLVFLLILYAHITEDVPPPYGNQEYYDNITPWDDNAMS